MSVALFFAFKWWAWLLIGLAAIVVIIFLLITLLVFDKSLVLDDPPYPPERHT
jgi:hypothetical protein